MTTVAYHNAERIVAVDGRVTSGDTVCVDTFKKWIRTKNALYIFAGAVCDYEALVSAVEDNVFPEYDIDCSALVIENGDCYSVTIDDKRVFKCKLSFNDAMGSGAAYAKSAMALGLCAKEAVEHAAKIDVYTGGIVTLFNVSDGSEVTR